MTERVKITQEQEDILLKIIHNNIFHGMKIRDVAAALTGDYEVEPEYGIDCWVLHENDQCQDVVTKIIDIQYENNRVQFDSVSDWQHIKSIQRHATPEEVFFKENGREPWELKEDDILYYDAYIFTVIETTDDIVCLYDNRNYCHIDRSTIKSKYAVACFSHDRKDVDHE